MALKNLLYFALPALLIGLAAGLFLAPGATHAPTASLSSASHALAVSIVTENETSTLYTVVAEYPQFVGLDDVNAAIHDYVSAAISDFKKNSKDNWDAQRATMPSSTGASAAPPDQPFYFEARWVPEQLNQNHISLLVTISSFEGGAHGNELITTFNYDVAHHRMVTLADLYPGDKNYLNEISTAARQELSASLDTASGGHTDKAMLNDGTAPLDTNFSNFVFNNTTITFYFQKYQVAPGVFGVQKISVPLPSEAVKYN